MHRRNAEVRHPQEFVEAKTDPQPVLPSRPQDRLAKGCHPAPVTVGATNVIPCKTGPAWPLFDLCISETLVSASAVLTLEQFNQYASSASFAGLSAKTIVCANSATITSSPGMFSQAFSEDFLSVDVSASANPISGIPVRSEGMEIGCSFVIRPSFGSFTNGFSNGFDANSYLVKDC